MTTMADLVADVKRTTYGSLAEQINLVATEYTAGSDTLYCELDVSGISAGVTVCSGLNTWYVKGVVSGEKKLLVVPGYDNSPSASVAVGDIITIRPHMTGWYAFTMLNDEIRRLSSSLVGLYQLASWTAVSDPTYQTYALPDDVSILQILRVRVRMPGTTDVWGDLPNSAWRYDPTNGLVQVLRAIPGGTSVQFIYKAPFVAASSLSDDVQSVCGLAETMNDIPVLGVASSLLLTTEARRNQVQTQGDPRRASEVSTTGNSMAAREMGRAYEARVQEEYARLLQQTPIFRGIA